jgi:hypothetical protein
MRESFGNIEQVPGDHNPIRAKFSHGFDDTIMPRLISVQVQICEMNGATTGKGRMKLGEGGHVMIGQTPFPMGNEAKGAIEGLAEAIAYERPQAVRP